MHDLISSDHPLTSTQQQRLLAVLDTLVPASEDGRLPSAAQMPFVDYLRAQSDPDWPGVQFLLDAMPEDFADTSLAQRCEQLQRFSVAEPSAFQRLLSQVYDCYYQQDVVRLAIGMVTGPVFPQGNALVAGDLGLLDPVLANADRHRYRSV